MSVLKSPCEQCPWRKSNQGKRHFGAFYTKANLRRLWNQIRGGGAEQSCHLTDPSHPDHIKAGAKETAVAQECPGSVILVRRELQLLANEQGQIEHIKPYLAKRKGGLTKNGILYWCVSRIAFAGKPGFGGPPIPDIADDDAIGFPEGLGPTGEP